MVPNIADRVTTASRWHRHCWRTCKRRHEPEISRDSVELDRWMPRVLPRVLHCHLLRQDPYFRDYLPGFEYFHGGGSRCLRASMPTGCSSLSAASRVASQVGVRGELSCMTYLHTYLFPNPS